ncbi:MAG: hypothetical protein IT379_04895 [Deltaproteobacteria bacterium]|nr:hypothetical protein [Deltaproteobacteria bacterium]
MTSRDETAHVYVVELPRSGPTTIALHVAPLATRHLVTLSEAQRSLSGAIELAVIDPPPTATESAVASVEDHVSGISWVAVPAALGVLGVLGALGLVLTRKRRRPEALLERRVKEALARLEREAVGAGPAFEEVIGTCRRLAGKSGEIRKHVEEIDRAIERTAWAKQSPGAQSQRDALRKEKAAALAQLRTLAERIEETATALAAHRAGRTGAKGIEDLLGHLRHDLETAVSAEDEARAI